MPQQPSLADYGAELRERTESLAERWIADTCARGWSLRSAAQSAPEVRAQLLGRYRHFLGCLSEALIAGADLSLGSALMREATQSLAFTAGWLAGVGMPVTDALAMVQALHGVLDVQSRAFLDGLFIVAAESHVAAVRERERVRYLDAMEKCQVVCELGPNLPVLFLTGDPDRRAVDDAVGRVTMLAMMRSAKVMLVDVSSLMFPEQVLASLCEALGEQCTAARATAIVSGSPPALTGALPGQPSDCVRFTDSVLAAMALAAARGCDPR